MADITPDLKNENILIDPEETKFDITEIIKNHIGNSVRLFQLQNKYSKMIYNKKILKWQYHHHYNNSNRREFTD